MKSDRIEILAPAGSLDAVKAAYSAGADAVYIGGSKFGARAFADNPDEEGLKYAIDYAHVRDRSLYLTVNTLFKERELWDELYDYLKPLYEQGLDAVIVQDLGVLKFVRENFPDMHIHASTQMTCTGYETAKIIEKLGANRVVTARELSLKEIRSIRDNTSLEIESFVHGAMCYSYSGQCLFSSLAGGRSGNRGRCAQPCRQSYKFYEHMDDKKPVSTAPDCSNLLSLKDMNALDILPQIVDAGVFSLKIEGRMKKPEYTAGVVSIYRKYVDLLLGGGAYRVDAEDQRKLFDLFNRDGFSRGYYETHNASSMLALKEPKFRARDEEWAGYIKKNYIDTEAKRHISGAVYVSRDNPVSLELYTDNTAGGATIEPASQALNRPTDEATLNKQLSKLGNTDFVLDDLSITLQDSSFITVGALNELRRAAVDNLRENILAAHLRTAPTKTAHEKSISKASSCKTVVQIHLAEQFEAALSEGVDEIYLDHTVKGDLAEYVGLARANGKRIFYHFPNVFRLRDRLHFEGRAQEIISAGFDGFLLGSLEAYGFVKDYSLAGELIADYNLYTFNDSAKAVLSELGFSRFCASPELNSRELSGLDNHDSEIIVYSRTAMMTTANCLNKTLSGCKHYDKPVFGMLSDKDNRRFPVEFDCISCSNIIYNCVPTYIADLSDKLSKLGFGARRIAFTYEDADAAKDIIRAVIDASSMRDITRGHFNRGVE
ncbi:MAG: U32 family peptidase [Lachnospiraceae bacterium]|nr:U32 family peptidase [Lachnospiraceae bacterium]